jgi:Protein of unknown function (DUF1236)
VIELSSRHRVLQHTTQQNKEEREMKFQRTTLLSGIAAIALIAGTGFGSAQESPKGEAPAKGAAPHATQQMDKTPKGAAPHATQQMDKTPEMNKAPGGKMQGAQEQERGAMPKHGSERADEPANKNGSVTHGNTAQEREPMGEKNRATEREHSTATEREGRMHGDTSVQLNEQQRSEIRRTVINGAPRAGHLDFDLAVGTVIPRNRIEIVPVPEALVQIEPEWRGFLYFVYEDEVVIVNPDDMRIVAVVPV